MQAQNRYSWGSAMPTAKKPFESPYQSILKWSSGTAPGGGLPWPAWQRDALRRIVLNGPLSSNDPGELELICRAAHGLKPKTGEVPAAVPLSTDHIATGPDSASSVSLVRLAALRNVNRLVGDPPLEFGPSPGLTVVFGDNGTGKSGYARVIKKACRARGAAQEIKPNAFDPTSRGPATADIVCSVGVVETPFKWTDGVPGDPRLSNIFVFDAMSARSHVSEDGPASFTPQGLDVLPKLARACDDLKARLKGEIEYISATIMQVHKNWRFTATTKVGALISRLGEETKDADVEAAATFSDEDRNRLRELTDALKSDPKQKAQATTASAQRIRTFSKQVEERGKTLSDCSVSAIRDAVNDAAAAEAAAKVALSPKLDDGYLAGTGGDAWRKLWDIAKSFSTTAAYPGQEFPVTAGAARCVLCQQSLDSQTAERLMRFDEYVRNEARSRAETASARLSQLKKDVDALDLLSKDYDRVSADVAAEPPESLVIIRGFVGSADARLAHVQKCLKDRVWVEVAPLMSSPITRLEHAAEALDRRAAMELSADDPERRKLLVAEQDGLEDREWLSRTKQEVLDQLARFRMAALLAKCCADTTTNTITIRSGELYDAHVTQAFCNCFKIERDALGLKTLQVELEPIKGSKGDRQFGVRLVGSKRSVHEVASEGEQRCIALAAFLAELSQASHKSALVFDDPVSSLDHARRTSLARRLCVEARQRQVIVFTHDPIFLCELLESAEGSGITPACRHLLWSGSSPGFCEVGLPWDLQKYKDRLDALGKEQRRMAGTWSPIPTPSNVADMRRAYSHFRATLEKIVQDVILSGVVARYRSWIKVELLEQIVGFSEVECKEALRLHKRACDVTEAHDPAAGKHAPVPSPDEFRDDVVALKALAEQAKQRRKAASPVGVVGGIPIKAAPTPTEPPKPSAWPKP